jgi:hypothetical protein
MAWKTGSSSPCELEMTLNTSVVAVCRCSDSRSSLSSRAFSMAMTAWAAKDLMSLICLSSNATASRCAVATAPITLPSRTIGAEIWELKPKLRADCSKTGGASGFPTIGAICVACPVRIAFPTCVLSSNGRGKTSANFSKPGAPSNPASSIMPSRSRKTAAKRVPNNRSRFRTITSNTAFASVVEPLIEESISPVAFCCSSASSRSRVSRATSVSWPEAEELLRRTVVALRRFGIFALRRRALVGSLLALERRRMGLSQGSGQGIVAGQTIARRKSSGRGFWHRSLRSQTKVRLRSETSFLTRWLGLLFFAHHTLRKGASLFLLRLPPAVRVGARITILSVDFLSE